MIREGSIHLPFSYAAGKAASRFLVALRDQRKILASPCEDCGKVYCPARSFCPACGAELEQMVEVGPRGTLLSWSETPDRGTFGLVLLAGADTSMVHRILPGGRPLRAGVMVRGRFAESRTGSILDLEGFEPVPEEES